jgi:glycosyltransferase involved in cell wall biosynthesis
MRVLHLFSNHKWTGPAEPALNLCVALRARGVDADFACAPGTGKYLNKVVETARDRGVDPILRFCLSKHRHPLHDFRDVRRLRAVLREQPYDLVHCHLDNDHRIAVNALKRAPVPVVRSSYEGDGLTGGVVNARLLSATAFLIEPSRKALERDRNQLNYPRDRMAVVPNAVDVQRFDPTRDVPDGRRWLNIPANAFVVGIVARMQAHRRYEDFWQAVRTLVDKQPNTHVIVIGRGTKQEQVGTAPVQALGLHAHVHFPGYLDGENYVGMLRALSVKVYLVPGSDGTCRAVREAMAMAKPVVAADRGMLREIVADGEEGYIFDGSAEVLFDRLYRLSSNRQKAHAMGQAARARAVADYSLEAQAARVHAIYDELLTKES